MASPLNGNKVLDLDGLSHLVDTYIKNVKAINDGTHLGNALSLTNTHGDVTSNLSLSVDYLSGMATLTATGDNLSNPAYWKFQATQGDNWVASTAYVDGKTWDASDLVSGTLSTARLPTVPVSKGGTGNTFFTANRVLTTGTTATGALVPSTITTTELGYLDGVTSNIQDQIDDVLGTPSSYATTAYINTIYVNKLNTTTSKPYIYSSETNVTSSLNTLSSGSHYMILSNGFMIEWGRTYFAGGSSPRNVNINMSRQMYRMDMMLVSESMGNSSGTAGGSSGTQYFDLLKGPYIGNTGSNYVTGVTIRIGVQEDIYVSWIALGRGQ